MRLAEFFGYPAGSYKGVKERADYVSLVKGGYELSDMLLNIFCMTIR